MEKYGENVSIDKGAFGNISIYTRACMESQYPITAKRFVERLEKVKGITVAVATDKHTFEIIKARLFSIEEIEREIKKALNLTFPLNVLFGEKIN